MTSPNEQQPDSISEFLAEIPMADLAERLGTDTQTAETAVREALPALLGGMRANAADPAGAASLAGALDQHPPGLVQGGVNLDEIDTDDGQRIVSHVFGDSSGAVAQTLGGTLSGGAAGGGGDLVRRLLPILAPIVLSYLSRRMRGGASQQSGGGLNDLLGSVLGGMGGAGGQGSSAGSVLDLLGGLLGGGRR